MHKKVFSTLIVIMLLVVIAQFNTPISSVLSSGTKLIDPEEVVSNSTTTLDGLSPQTHAFYAKGYHWIFFSNGTLIATDLGEVYYVSSDDDLAFSYSTSVIEHDGAATGLWYADARQFAVYYDESNDKVHFTYLAGGENGGVGNQYLHYIMGVPNTNGTITWGTWYHILFFVDVLASQGFPTISVDSSGYPWIGYTFNPTGSGAGYYPYCIRSSTKNGVWTTEFTQVLDAWSDYYYFRVGFTPLASRNMYIFDSRNGNDIYNCRVEGRLYTQGVGFGAVDFNIDLYPRYYDRWDAASENSDVYISYRTTDGTINWSKRTWGVGWGVTSNVWSSSYDYNQLVVVRSYGFISIVPYSTSAFVYKLYKTSLSAWSDATTFCNSTNIFTPFTAFYDVNATRVGIMFLNGTSSPYSIMYSFMGGFGPSGLSTMTIDNMDAGDWLFAEERYYIFHIETISVNDTVLINFTDGAGNLIMFGYDIVESLTVIPNGTDYVSVDTYRTYHAIIGTLDVMKFYVLIRGITIDKIGVDFYAYMNTTDGAGEWVLAAEDYASIYSRGGISQDYYTGPSYRITGGDLWSFHCEKGSYYYTQSFYRNLQHIKIKFCMSFGNAIAVLNQTARMSFNLGMKFKYDESPDVWQTGWGIVIELDSFPPSWADDRWLAFNVSLYNNFLLVAGPVKMYTFYDYDGGLKVPATFWVDMWINKVNASSVFGFRITPYWYAMAKNGYSAFGTSFGQISGTWVPQVNYSTSTMFLDTMRSVSGDIVYARQIRLQELWAKADYPDLGNATVFECYDYSTFDITIAQKGLDGIQTPTFEETKAPTLPQWGVLSALFSALQGVFSELAAMFYPVFTAVSSYLIAGLDYALGFTGNPHVMSDIVSLVTTGVGILTNSITYIVATIGSYSSILLYVPSYFTNYIWNPVWNTVSFIATPTFNFLGWSVAIFGIFGAWFAGTSYTSVFGQTYNFTYMSQMRFGVFTGGSAIIAIITMLYFFIAPVLCITSRSLYPITAPFKLAYSVLDFLGRIATLLWQILHSMWSVISGFISMIKWW